MESKALNVLNLEFKLEWETCVGVWRRLININAQVVWSYGQA